MDSDTLDWLHKHARKERLHELHCCRGKQKIALKLSMLTSFGTPLFVWILPFERGYIGVMCVPWYLNRNGLSDRWIDHGLLNFTGIAVFMLCGNWALNWIGSRLQSHFESIQRISDTTTLPSVLPQLKASLFSKVDLSGLTEKLILGKDDPQLLSQRDKVQLWQELKTLSELLTLLFGGCSFIILYCLYSINGCVALIQLSVRQ